MKPYDITFNQHGYNTGYVDHFDKDMQNVSAANMVKYAEGWFEGYYDAFGVYPGISVTELLAGNARDIRNRR